MFIVERNMSCLCQQGNYVFNYNLRPNDRATPNRPFVLPYISLSLNVPAYHRVCNSGS